MTLTPRQLDVAVAIRGYRHLHGFAPTMQELADILGTSKVTIFEHCAALERKRVITRTPNVARSIAVRPEVILPDDERSTKLPLLGDIAAGDPIRQTEAREELDLEQLFAAKGGVYTLRVQGESMKVAHLMDGDYLVVERCDTPRRGERVVVSDHGVASLRLFDGPRDGVAVLGTVLGMLRSY